MEEHDKEIIEPTVREAAAELSADAVVDAPVPGGEVTEVDAEEAAPKKSKVKAAKPKEKFQPRELSDEQKALPWYAIHTYAGFESRARLSLEERIRTSGLGAFFGDIVVPEETVVELQKGVKKTASRKLFPSYMLVQMRLNDDSWHLVKDTPKVTGFVGDARNPSPLTPEEMSTLVTQMEGGAQRPKPKVTFESGDAVKVIDGPFAEFNGTVDEVKADKGKLRVLISIFGRNTPVELDFVQVEKV